MTQATSPVSPTVARPGASRRARLPATFRALRHRNYLYWFIGQTISLVGTWMQTMAQQVLVYRLTGSAASLGIISFIGLIPIIPLSLWGGSISDRVSKRKIILIAQAVMAIQAFILAYLTWTGSVQIWQVYALALVLGAATAIDLPARQAFTVDMIEGKEDLANAIGLNSAMFNGARALGPALAGLVVAAVGEGPAFFLNALSFLAVIASLLLMKNLPNSSRPPQKGVDTLAHMAEGIRFVYRQKIILALISLIAVSAFLSMPYSTLMPVFADRVLKESSAPVIAALCTGERALVQCKTPEALPLGILLTMIGVGAVTGALVVASQSSGRGRGRMLTAGNLAFPALLVIISINRSFLAAALLLALIGFAFVWQNALANTLLQLVTPDDKRGRVMGLYTLTFQTMMRIGGLQAGFMADWIGAPLSVGIGALLSLFYGLFIAVRYPAIRRL